MPLEIITFGISTIVGIIATIIRLRTEQSIERDKMFQRTLKQQGEFWKDSREHGLKDEKFSFTRRTIALASVFSIIVLPKLVAIFQPDMLVWVGYTEIQGGFWNWLFGPEEVIEWRSLQGFVITPLDTHLVSAIVGLYFGGAFAGKR